MTPIFLPQLVNGPLGDPVLYIEFKFEHRAILFDLGDIQALPPRKLLKISEVFVTHTHMDHFIGFDHLLRTCLGREKQLRFYGPPGFIARVEAKLQAYTWNLLENYRQTLEIIAIEVYPDRRREARFSTRQAFRRLNEPDIFHPFDGRLHHETGFDIRAVFLDHKIPILGYALEERKHVNILRTGLEELGLPKGLWLKGLKQAVWEGQGDERPIRVWCRTPALFPERDIPLGILKKRLVRTTPGQKIAFVVDTVFNQETEKSLIALVHQADLLFIETPFLEADRDRAREKHHLTASQAGDLARRAGVKRLIPMHFSPKYTSQPEVLDQEALRAFAGSSQGTC